MIMNGLVPWAPPPPEGVVVAITSHLAAFLKLIGFLATAEWIIEHPTISLTAGGAFIWGIFALAQTKN
jgi:hypothetical protein